MDDAFTREAQRENEMELVRREMARKSRDLIRVFNPTKYPFRFTWDSYPIIIPAQGYKNIERYLAEVYLRKMSQKLISEQMMKEGKELLELRQKQFGKTFTDKYEENKEVWDRVPKLNDPKLIDEISKVIIIGLDSEYGVEEVPEREEILEKQETPYDEAYKRMDHKILEPLEEVNA